MSGNKVVPMENTALKAMALERQDAEGIEFPRHFTKEGTNPYDTVEWEERTAVIMSEKGEEIFRQDGVEVPKSWSQRATNIVVSKYFHGQVGTPQRERLPAPFSLPLPPPAQPPVQTPPPAAARRRGKGRGLPSPHPKSAPVPARTDALPWRKVRKNTPR